MSKKGFERLDDAGSLRVSVEVKVRLNISSLDCELWILNGRGAEEPAFSGRSPRCGDWCGAERLLVNGSLPALKFSISSGYLLYVLCLEKFALSGNQRQSPGRGKPFRQSRHEGNPPFSLPHYMASAPPDNFSLRPLRLMHR
jgi:hypothetical protein